MYTLQKAFRAVKTDVRVLLQGSNLNSYLFHAKKKKILFYGVCKSLAREKVLGPALGLTSSETVAKSMGSPLCFPHL